MHSEAFERIRNNSKFEIFDSLLDVFAVLFTKNFCHGAIYYCVVVAQHVIVILIISVCEMVSAPKFGADFGADFGAEFGADFGADFGAELEKSFKKI